MLSLSNRACVLGKRVVIKQVTAGDENIIAMELKIGGVTVDDTELNILMKEPHSHNILFNSREGGKFIEPVFKGLKPFVRELPESDVEITLAVGSTEVTYLGCIMKNIAVACVDNGDAMLSFDIQCMPPEPLRSEILRIAERAGCEIRLELHAPKFGETEETVSEEQCNLSLGDGTKVIWSRKKSKSSNGKRKRHEDRPGAH